MIVIDLETSALPDEQLLAIMPTFEAPANYSDPVKITKAIEEKRQAWKDKAALSPLTGQILAVGLLGDEGEQILTGTEAGMLEVVWKLWDEGERFVGFNVKEFDFRYMVTRSRILGVPIPSDLFAGRYWNSRIICLQEIVACYSRDVSGYSLDAICRVMGIGGKPYGVTGKDFARLFVENREAALEYLRNDLRMEAALAKRLGIV